VGRWKNLLIKHLSNIKNSDYRNYHEPFLGGAATFFYLEPNKEAYLSDLNGELIETYQSIKDNATAVIETLSEFKNTEDFYYEMRDKNYSNAIDRAARFIYLNQTSFNGIYRVNLKGIYNVPFGFRTKAFLDPQNLLGAQQVLAKAHLSQCDFMKLLKM
jgi:DNA adenine methylase